MTEHTTLAFFFGSLCAFAGVTAAAQSSDITGRVHVSGDTARPVIDAELTLLPGLRTVRSDSTGAFRFTAVSPGMYTLRARRVGFEVFTQDVAVIANQERLLTVDVPMRIGAQILAEVTISGRRVMFPARLAEPYARVARVTATFFTRELIDSLQPWDVSSLLQRVAGVRVNDRGIEVARCAGGGANLGSDALVHVYVDGVRLTKYNKILGYGALQAVRDVAIDKVQLIEVHTSINSIPPEYAADACAVILIWSQ